MKKGKNKLPKGVKNEGTALRNILKGYLIGVLSTTLLLGTVSYAANTTTLYDVIVNGIKIVVDGQKLNPADANGNPVEPMIYNGTTYLPVRAVANAFGKAVYWDGPEYTVYLGDMDGKLEYPTTYLKDATNVSSFNINGCTGKDLVDNYGNRYSNALWSYANIRDYSNGGHPYIKYLTNMKYSRFKTVLYKPEGTAADSKKTYIEIEADGRIIYTSPIMDETSHPIYVDVDITGYNVIQINFLIDNGDYGEVYLADAGFYQ